MPTFLKRLPVLYISSEIVPVEQLLVNVDIPFTNANFSMGPFKCYVMPMGVGGG